MIKNLVYDYLVFEKEYKNPKIEQINKISDDIYDISFTSDGVSNDVIISLLDLLGFAYNSSQKIHFTKAEVASAKPSGKDPDYERYRKELAKDDWKKYSSTQKRYGLLDNPH